MIDNLFVPNVNQFYALQATFYKDIVLLFVISAHYFQLLAVSQNPQAIIYLDLTALYKRHSLLEYQPHQLQKKKQYNYPL